MGLNCLWRSKEWRVGSDVSQEPGRNAGSSLVRLESAADDLTKMRVINDEWRRTTIPEGEDNDKVG
jgi:hypothetical protein